MNTSSTASGPFDVFKENSTVACDMLPKGEGFGEITAAHPSIAQKRDLREPSLVREGGPLAVDE